MSKASLKYVLTGCVLAAMLATSPAFAHAILETDTGTAGKIYKGAIEITHGCKGSATISVDLTIPDGLVGVKPVAKPGWTIETRRGPYAKEYSSPHGAAKEGVREIIWSGGRLPDDFVDDFAFRGTIAADISTGVLYFPIVQGCEQGEHRWVEIPKQGQSAKDLGHPAPALTVLAADDPSRVAAGSLVIENAFTRPTPAGAQIAVGYLTIVNTGKEADRLVAATADISARTEIHETTMQNGVAEMRELTNGLTIPAGATAVLKPGGGHIMFVGLKRPVKPGDTIHATLAFEKAGKVEVGFKAAASMGAMSPDNSMGGMQH